MWPAWLAAGALLLGCSAADGTPPADATSIAGTITRVGGTPPVAFVEAVPGAPGGDKAVARITRRTRIRLDGEPAGPGDLRIGQRARIWFDGPVLMTYPARGDAALIALEPAD